VVQLQILVDCSGNDSEEKNPETAFTNKKTTLVKIVEESPVGKSIIFCNKVVSLPSIPLH
jgi:ATP-dependent RNA helicase DDX18/HAS1